MITTGLQYHGDVSVKIKNKTNYLHNAGSSDLFSLFSKFLVGLMYVKAADLPTYINLQGRLNETEGFVDCLANKLTVNKSFTTLTINGVSTPATVIEATILYDNVTDVSSFDLFQLTLEDATEKVLASTSVPKAIISTIQPGTHALISWKLYITNNTVIVEG